MGFGAAFLSAPASTAEMCLTDASSLFLQVSRRRSGITFGELKCVDASYSPTTVRCGSNHLCRAVRSGFQCARLGDARQGRYEVNSMNLSRSDRCRHNGFITLIPQPCPPFLSCFMFGPFFLLLLR